MIGLKVSVGGMSVSRPSAGGIVAVGVPSTRIRDADLSGSALSRPLASGNIFAGVAARRGARTLSSTRRGVGRATRGSASLLTRTGRRTGLVLRKCVGGLNRRFGRRCAVG